jgi:hypothetical protein
MVLCVVLGKFRWVFPVVFTFLIYRSGASLLGIVVGSIILSALYFVYVVPIVMNVGAMVALLMEPIPWVETVASSAKIGRIFKVRFSSFLASNYVEFYTASFALSLALVRFLFPDVYPTSDVPVGRRLAALGTLLLLNAITRLVMLWCQSPRGGAPSIILLRRFHREISEPARSALVPILSVYGEVKTIGDPSYKNADPINVDWAPYGEAVVLSQTPVWRDFVPEQIEASDLVVIDVGDVSKALAWELARCLEMKRGRVLLVAPIKHLMWARGTVLDNLINALAPHVGDPTKARELLRYTMRPLPYTEDSSNIVFSWRAYRYFCQLSKESVTSAKAAE